MFTHLEVNCVAIFLIQVTLWEIFNEGNKPWNLFSNSEVYEIVTAGVQKLQQGNCDDYTYSICLKCWNQDPKNRPSFGTVLEELEKHPQRKTSEFRAINEPQEGSYEISPTSNKETHYETVDEEPIRQQSTPKNEYDTV